MNAPYVELNEVAPEKISGVISVLDVKPDDTLVFSVELGRIPPSSAANRIQALKTHIRALFPESVRVLIIPMIHGKPDVEITVLRKEE